MDVDRAVLVVVDAQNGFINDESRHIVPIVANLLTRWRQCERPTIFTRYINYPGSPFEQFFDWSRMRSSPETDIVPELRQYLQGSLVIDKHLYTLFTPEGSAVVDAGGWTDILICGVATESCVCKTAVDAFERGLTPWVLIDACASHDGSKAHEAGLLVTRRFIGRRQMITTDFVLSKMSVIKSS